MADRPDRPSRNRLRGVLLIILICFYGNYLLIPEETQAMDIVKICFFNMVLLTVLYAAIRQAFETSRKQWNLRITQAETRVSSAEDKLKERQMLLTISQLTEMYLESEELKPVLTSLADRVQEQFEVESVLVTTINDRDAEKLDLITSGSDIGNLESISTAIKSWTKGNKSTLVNNIHTNDDYAKKFDGTVHSFMASPFAIQNRPLGYVALISNRKRDFTSHDLDNLARFTKHASILIDSAKMIELNKKLSLTDELTGVSNKREYNRRLSSEFQRAARYGHPISLLTFDIDNFKHYNDTNGHPAGDKLLRELGALLNNNTRSTDFAARVGGEEFAVVLVETNKEEALKYAEKIRKLIEETTFDHQENQPTGNLTISLGVSTFPGDAENVLDLIQASDIALYQSKHSGRNKVTGFEKRNTE